MSRPRRPGIWVTAALVVPGSFFLLGCQDDGGRYVFDPERVVHPEFDGDRALAHVAALVDFGPRPAGSRALEASRGYLAEELAKEGWVSQEQRFVDETPLGEIEFANLRARFCGDDESTAVWSRRAEVLIGSHIDTKYYENIRFVGANDSGSSTGALLEMARVMAKRPDLARRVELVFFDGEEAFEEYNATDGLYGSRHYVRQITRRQPPGERPRAIMILDLVGEKDLNIGVPRDTPGNLVEAMFRAARELGYERYFGVFRTPITDDHVPFVHEGLPAINLIDLDYDAWHTSLDTMDQLSAESLEIVGRTALLILERDLLSL